MQVVAQVHHAMTAHRTARLKNAAYSYSTPRQQETAPTTNYYYSVREQPAEQVETWNSDKHNSRALATAGVKEQSLSPRVLLLPTAPPPSHTLSRSLSHCIQIGLLPSSMLRHAAIIVGGGVKKATSTVCFV